MVDIDALNHIESTPVESMNEKYSLEQVEDAVVKQNEIVIVDQPDESSLKKVEELRSSDDWEEVVAYEYLSPSARAHSLTATTLRGEGMIAKLPIKFFNKDKTACVMAIHLGTNLCGHDGIIHGGLAATLLDEMLAYVTIPSLPGSSGFTANLNINYRKPIMSNRWVIVQGELVSLEGRKAWGKAWIETTEEIPVVLTEATALYISPRDQGPITKF